DHRHPRPRGRCAHASGRGPARRHDRARRCARPRRRRRRDTGPMRLWRMTIRAALGALRRNPLRSGLTMLGVVIGVAAVVAMVSVGQGADASVQAQLANLGTNIVMIFPGATTAGGVRSGSGSAQTLTVADARAIGRECPSVGAVTWLKREIAQVAVGNRNWSTGVQGSPPSYPEVRDWPIERGRFFTQAEEDAV